MSDQMILCIPGLWKDKSDFIRHIMTSQSEIRFMYAGMLLVDLSIKEHAVLEFEGKDPDIAKAFTIAGQNKISTEAIENIKNHESVVYLSFPLGLKEERETILIFTRFLKSIGGIAIKVESSGIAHEWNRWLTLLEDGSDWALYRLATVLIGSADKYYSCGMHHFNLPEAAVNNSLPNTEAAELLNQFNLYQITEKPELKTGNTFSLEANAPAYKLNQTPDTYHDPDDLFHNLNGIWHLTQA